MTYSAKQWAALLVLLGGWAASVDAVDNPALRAYPDPLPEDATFDTVVKSQPFPFMKYPVGIIGAKFHPEEFQVTPSGQIMLPNPGGVKGLCLAALLGVQPAGGSSPAVAPALPPADSVAARLVDGYMPAVENQWTMGDLELRQLAFATCGGKFESVTGREPLVALVRYTVANKSSSPQKAELAIQFGQAQEGLSVLAVPPVYPKKLSFAPPFVRQEDAAIVACLLTRDVKAEFKPSAAPNDAETNRLKITLSLAAGESKSIELAVPYFPIPEKDRGLLENLRFDDELGRFREFWTRELNRNAEFIVPEKRIRDAYRACLAYNLLLIDRDPNTGVPMPHPDPLYYESVWAGDGSVSMQATDRMGYHKEAEGMLDYFLARQGKDKPDGDVQSAEGFLSGDVDLKWMNQNGFILWALAEHFKLTHDEQWLRRVASQMVKGCDWIARERAKTKVTENGQKVKHYGLLPKGRPSDLKDWDNWYWTDTYSYMGLRGTADVLAAIGMNDEAKRLLAEADDYKACILDSVARSMDPQIKPPFVPPTPYRLGPPSFKFFDETWYTISSPLYMVEAGLLDPCDEKVAGMAYWIEKSGMYTGLPAFTPGSIDPYYVYNQSLAQLLRGEASKFVWTLYSITAYAMSQGNYVTIEGQNLVTGCNGPGWDVNRQPHMHSNSRFMDLVRIALLLEEGDTLHLLAGTPRGWLADGQTIEVRRAPSNFGEVNFTARSNIGAGKIVFDLEPTPWQKPSVVLHVRVPSKYGKIKSVTVDGQPWKDYDGDSVRLPRLEKKTQVICTF